MSIDFIAQSTELNEQQILHLQQLITKEYICLIRLSEAKIKTAGIANAIPAVFL